jgi:hypothetical protein
MRNEKPVKIFNPGTTGAADITERAIQQAIAAIRAAKQPAKPDQSSGNVMRLVSYEITFEPLTDGSPPETPELSARYNDLHPGECDPEDRPRLLSELESLHNQYPDDAKIANYLTAMYTFLGRDADRDRISEDLYRRHPDYLFAIIGMISSYLYRDEVEKARAILNNRHELSMIYPERKIFHISEFTGFYRTIVRYYIACGELEKAKSSLKIFKSVAPDDPAIPSLDNLLVLQGMKERFSNVFPRLLKSKRAAEK